MGLATSQVRLLALTSRKSDVEFNMQLNAKRKTMLLREGTTLSKLYYAKLQQARYQYSTEEGYNDVTYGYIMGVNNGTTEPTIEQIKNGTYTADMRNIPGAFIIDSSGNVVVNDELFDAIKTTNGGNTETSAELVLRALSSLCSNGILNKEVTIGTTDDQKLYNQNGSSNTKVNLLKFLAEYSINDTSTESSNNVSDFGSRLGEFSLLDDLGKIAKDIEKFNFVDKSSNINVETDKYFTWNGALYYAGRLVEGSPAAEGNEDSVIYICSISNDQVKALMELGRLYEYYGEMLNYIFEGGNCRIAQKDGKNSYYEKILNTDYLQEAFRSGTFTLSLLDEDNEYTQSLDYFMNKSYFIEKADTESRETITAWYNAKKAELDEKETYWDSEINALSTELETINTEMESIKSLRDNAIQTTFKWGAA